MSAAACSQSRGCSVALGARRQRARRAARGAAKRVAATASTSIQFIRGVNESTVPDVRLTRAKDGQNGAAYFTFAKPDVFEASAEMGEITGLYLIDEEGELTSTEVSCKFINGKPSAVEAKMSMRSAFEWDRFMRFMERYAEEQGLGFEKANKK